MNGMGTMATASLVALLLGTALAAQEVSQHTARWTNYETWLWMYEAPPEGAELYQALRGLGVFGQCVDGLASNALAVANGFRFYNDHAAGKGYLYLREEDWKRCWDGYTSRRDPQFLVRPNCFNNPDAIKWLHDRLTKGIGQNRDGHPGAYSLDDEISVTSYANPFDFCFCPYCLEKFRAWLRETYPSLDALNAQWGTSFSSWEEVKPLTTWETRDREYPQPPEKYNFSPWADHRTFMDISWAARLQELVSLAHQLDPSAPAGFEGGQAPSAFGGYDWWRLMQVVDWVEPYDIGGSREMIRSFARPGTRVVKTTFPMKTGPADQVYSVWYYFAHGDAGSIIWSAGDYFQEKDLKRPTDYARNLKDVFQELQGGLAEKVMLSDFLPTPVAIYYSQPSIQVNWMLDSKKDGDTWPRRFGSWEREHSSLIGDRVAWMRLIEDLGLQYTFIAYEEVKQGALRGSAYKVLILPKTIALSEKEIDELRAFVEAGGLLIADYQVGLFDEHGKSRGRGALDDLFGVTRKDFSVAEDYGKVAEAVPGRALGLALMESSLRATTGQAEGTVADVPHLIRKTSGKGSTLYLNLGVMDYGSQRLKPEGNPALLEKLRQALAQAGVQADVTVRANGKELPLCERIWRKKGNDLYLFILRNVAPSATPTGEAGEGSQVGTAPVTIEVTLAKPATVTNLRTGKALGQGTSFTDSLLPYEANIYRVE